MNEIDKHGDLTDYITARCNSALCRYEKENAEYRGFIQRRILLSEKVKPFTDTKEEMRLSSEMQAAVREYIDVLMTGQNMEEMVVCYKQGFGDALHIVIDTGALPEQR